MDGREEFQKEGSGQLSQKLLRIRGILSQRDTSFEFGNTEGISEVDELFQ